MFNPFFSFPFIIKVQVVGLALEISVLGTFSGSSKVTTRRTRPLDSFSICWISRDWVNTAPARCHPSREDPRLFEILRMVGKLKPRPKLRNHLGTGAYTGLALRSGPDDGLFDTVFSLAGLIKERGKGEPCLELDSSSLTGNHRQEKMGFYHGVRSVGNLHQAESVGHAGIIEYRSGPCPGIEIIGIRFDQYTVQEAEMPFIKRGKVTVYDVTSGQIAILC